MAIATTKNSEEPRKMAMHADKLNLARAVELPELAARRAVKAACFGFFVDMFDVYLPIAVLAPALTYFIPAGLSGKAEATIFYVVFAVTLIGRPLGALIFGYFGDLLVLLSQKVAAVVETNHVFGEIHFSACEGLRWVCQDQVTRRRGFRHMSRV
jgi:hypothetical protein